MRMGAQTTSLKSAIEEALYKAAPDLAAVTVDVEAERAKSVFIPLADLRSLTGSVQPS